MVVIYHGSVEALVRDLEARHLEPRVSARSGGTPARVAQVEVRGSLIVHWDRDSRSVWVEGPRAQAERLERYLRARYTKHWLTRELAKCRLSLDTHLSRITDLRARRDQNTGPLRGAKFPV